MSRGWTLVVTIPRTKRPTVSEYFPNLQAALERIQPAIGAGPGRVAYLYPRSLKGRQEVFGPYRSVTDIDAETIFETARKLDLE